MTNRAWVELIAEELARHFDWDDPDRIAEVIEVLERAQSVADAYRQRKETTA